MKTLNATSQTTRLLGTCTALFSSIVIASSSAMADDTAEFEAADLDASGSLVLAEFKTTLSAHTPQKQLLKKFKRADANADSAVTLQEWLAYKDELEEEITDREKYTANFETADGDDDGFLSYEEFIPAIPGKRPLIKVRERFLRADTDGDFFVSLDEWLAMKEDNMGDPIKRTKFDLADFDGDNQLTPEEFTTTFPRKTKSKTVLKKFNREDENDDGFLTRDEWNPGGKGLTEQA